MTWTDILNKSVREHHKIWYENTNHWPDFNKNEQIHHIDGDKLNNNFDNLVLCSVSEHAKIHKNYEDLACRLIKEGLVKFDKSKNELNLDGLKEILENAGWQSEEL